MRESRRQIIIAAGPTKLDSSAAADDEVIGLKHIWPRKVAAPGLLREMEKDFLNGDSQSGSTAEIARKFPQQKASYFQSISIKVEPGISCRRRNVIAVHGMQQNICLRRIFLTPGGNETNELKNLIA